MNGENRAVNPLSEVIVFLQNWERLKLDHVHLSIMTELFFRSCKQFWRGEPVVASYSDLKRFCGEVPDYVIGRHRDELAAMGLLTFEKGCRGRPTRYRLVLQARENKPFNPGYVPPPEEKERAENRNYSKRPRRTGPYGYEHKSPSYNSHSDGREYRGLSHWREDNKELLERVMKNRGRRVIQFESLQESDSCDKINS